MRPATNKISRLEIDLNFVDPEVGGSSPPNCTNSSMAYSEMRSPGRMLSGTFVRDFLGGVSHSLKGGTLSRAFGRNAPHFVSNINISPRRIEVAVSRHGLGRNGATGRCLQSCATYWQSGHEDTKRTLRNKDWLAMPPENTGIVTHDIHRDQES
jgi:hypothetical protein